MGLWKGDIMKRNSNIELLRILCMYAITLHHLILHSAVLEHPFTGQSVLPELLILFGKIATNIFILITGYFMIQSISQSYKSTLKKAIQIWGKIFLYCVLCLAFGMMLGDKISAAKLLKSFFPISTKMYWFMTAYFGLLLISPFLNRFAASLSREEYEKFLLVCAVLMILPPKNVWASDFIWFVALYFAAGDVRLHGFRWLRSQKSRIACALISVLVMWIGTIALSVLSLRFPAIEGHRLYFALRQNSIFMFAASISIFLIFLNMKKHDSKFICTVSVHVLPCYLIQSNLFVSGRLWTFVDEMLARWDYNILLILLIPVALMIPFVLIDVVLSRICGLIPCPLSKIEK